MKSSEEDIFCFSFMYRALLKAAVFLILCFNLSLAFRPAEFIPHYPLTEDGYYVLRVARNIGLGLGITWDGHSLTNGFQPLWVFLNALGYFFVQGDKIMGLRLVLIMHALIHFASALLFGHIVKRSFVYRTRDEESGFGLLAVLIYSSSSHVMMHHFNGLETGLVMLMYLICWKYYMDKASEHWGFLVSFGVLIGITLWARVDAIFLLAAVGIYLGFLRPLTGDWRLKLWKPAVVGATAVLTSAPWWFFNLMVGGNLMPSSGAAQQGWGNQWARLFAVLDHSSLAFVPIFSQSFYETSFGFCGATYTPQVWCWRILILLTALVGMGLGWAGIKKVLRGDGGTGISKTSLVFTAILSAAMALTAAYYFVTTYNWIFYGRYLAPLNLSAFFIFILLFYAHCRLPRTPKRIAAEKLLVALVIILYAMKAKFSHGDAARLILNTVEMRETAFYICLGLAAAVLLTSIPNLTSSKSVVAQGIKRVPRLNHILFFAMPIYLIAVSAVNAGIGWKIPEHQGWERSSFIDEMIPLLEKYVPAKERVGTLQSGTVGYFREHVLNLDGKVNWEAIRNKQDIESYVIREGVRWVCDWRGLLPSSIRQSSRWKLVETRMRSREDLDHAVDLYKRMD